jgi:predicted glycosyltransferase
MGDLGSLVRLRSSILLTVVSHFDPDVIVVDRLPVGLAGDFLPVLRCLENARRRPWLVLGLSDIVDTAKRVDQEWDACGVWEWIDRYDDILVYGDSAIETTASELRLADRVRGAVTHTGYVAPRMPEALAPRTTPSAEQNIRARRLSRVTRLERCSADRLTPDRVADFVLRCACGVRPSMDHPQLLDLTGVTTAARLLTGGRVGAMEPSVA